MKPEQLVPSLETCKKLKDFPETYFNYQHSESRKKYVLGNRDMFLDAVTKKSFIPAPTVAELLEVLPEHLTGDKGRCHLSIGKLDTEEGMAYDVCYEHGGEMITQNGELLLSEQICFNPAEALALLYIELKEKGII